MKKIAVLILYISIVSCSLSNTIKVEFSIKNNSSKTISEINFKTGYDSIQIKELLPGESYRKEILYCNLSDNKQEENRGFYLSFLRTDKDKPNTLGCGDILSNDNSDKKIDINIFDSDFKSDIEGIECY